MLAFLRKLFGLAPAKPQPTPSVASRTTSPNILVAKPTILTGPAVVLGSPVWWRPKSVGLSVQHIYSDGSVLLQGGPIVRNKSGREVPRWSVATLERNLKWHADINMWSLGQGPLPKNVRGQVITPDPVYLSGVAQGSFATQG